ncbi:MAG: SCO family protein [Gracilimonas sp.]
MKTFITFTLAFLGILTLEAVAQHSHHQHEKEALKAGEVYADHSLYHLDSEFTDHRNEAVKLGDFQGEPVIVVMFYGNCTQVCPILIQDTWRLYSSLDESIQQKVNVLAVSFDTENDTPEVLKEYAEYEELDIPGWHFLTGKHTDIKMLATMLGVKYQQTSDGHFAHSNLVTVLDTEGKVAKRVEGLNQPMEDAAVVIEAMLENL